MNEEELLYTPLSLFAEIGGNLLIKLVYNKDANCKVAQKSTFVKNTFIPCVALPLNEKFKE